MKKLNGFQYAVKRLSSHGLQPLSYSTGTILNRPQDVFLEITDRCCLRCRQCDMWRNYARDDGLTVEDKMAVIDELKTWLGHFRLHLTGGEPLLRPDEILLLIAHADSLDIETSTNSNGWPLDDDLARKLGTSGLNNLILSVDSTDPAKHDHIRGLAGSHAKVLEAIDRMRPYDDRMALSINTILMGYTTDEMPDLVKWAAEKGVAGIGFQALDSNASFGGEGYKKEWYKESEFFPRDPDQMDRIIDCLIRMKTDGFPITNSRKELETFKAYFRDPLSFTSGPCYTGVKNLIINKLGEIRLCFLMKPIGRARSGEPLSAIWSGETAKTRRRAIKACRRTCRLNACNKRQTLAERVGAFGRRLDFGDRSPDGRHNR